MSTPVPYGKSSLDSSPLSSGTQYPCKQRSGVYNDEGARAKNAMAIGATQQLSFAGSATHGGGSCQISLSTDKEPTKNSKFAVIKSIEGGCPGGVNGGSSATFEYSIPSKFSYLQFLQLQEEKLIFHIDSVAPGEYTLACKFLIYYPFLRSSRSVKHVEAVSAPKAYTSAHCIVERGNADFEIYLGTWFNRIGNREIYSKSPFLDSIL